MSVEAITWALKQSIAHSSAKFVLVVMANCASNDAECYPSIAYLAESTGQDRKTVIANLERLRSGGWIEDTGERKGRTKQIAIYRIIVRDRSNDTENGTVQKEHPNTSKNPENGTVKASQNRDCSTDETVPFFPSNSTVFPPKESRFSAERVPKTGHGYERETKGKRNKKEPCATPAIELPGWMPAETWAMFLEHRKEMKAPMSAIAQQRTLHELNRLREAGSDPPAVIDQSIVNRWKGVFPVKDQQQQTRRRSIHDERSATIASLTGRDDERTVIEGHAGIVG